MQQLTQNTDSSKALGYLRISDKKQMKGESIANQKASIEKYAAALWKAHLWDCQEREVPRIRREVPPAH